MERIYWVNQFMWAFVSRNDNFNLVYHICPLALIISSQNPSSAHVKVVDSVLFAESVRVNKDIAEQKSFV